MTNTSNVPSQTTQVRPQFTHAHFKKIGETFEINISKTDPYRKYIADLPAEGRLEALCETLKSFIRDNKVGISALASLGSGVLATLTVILSLPVLTLHSIALPALAGSLLIVGLYNLYKMAISKDPLKVLEPSDSRLWGKIIPECIGRQESLNDANDIIHNIMQSLAKQIQTEKDKIPTLGAEHFTSQNIDYHKNKHSKIELHDLFSTTEKAQAELKKGEERIASAKSEIAKHIEYIGKLVKSRKVLFDASVTITHIPSNTGQIGLTQEPPVITNTADNRSSGTHSHKGNESKINTRSVSNEVPSNIINTPAIPVDNVDNNA